MRIEFYVIFSVVCAVIIMNGVSLLLKRAENEFELEDASFSDFLFSPYGLQALILSFVPLLNLIITIAFIFIPENYATRR